MMIQYLRINADIFGRHKNRKACIAVLAPGIHIIRKLDLRP